MIIGITGSIGSGKTTAANLFKKHGFKVINADKIGHKLIKKNSAAYKKIIKEFGKEILDKSKNIDRRKLRGIVFNDYGKLEKLNSIMHPLILNEIKNSIKKGHNQDKIIIDAPLLLETKAKDLVDKVVVVKCSKKNILRRNKKCPRQEIEKILKLQMPIGEKLKHADFAIDNNKDLGHLKNQIRRLSKKLDDY